MMSVRSIGWSAFHKVLGRRYTVRRDERQPANRPGLWTRPDGLVCAAAELAGAGPAGGVDWRLLRSFSLRQAVHRSVSVPQDAEPAEVGLSAGGDGGVCGG